MVQKVIQTNAFFDRKENLSMIMDAMQDIPTKSKSVRKFLADCYYDISNNLYETKIISSCYLMNISSADIADLFSK